MFMFLSIVICSYLCMYTFVNSYALMEDPWGCGDADYKVHSLEELSCNNTSNFITSALHVFKVRTFAEGLKSHEHCQTHGL